MRRGLLHVEYEVNDVVQYPKDEEPISVAADEIDKRDCDFVQLVDQNSKDCNDKKYYDFVPAIQLREHYVNGTEAESEVRLTPSEFCPVIQYESLKAVTKGNWQPLSIAPSFAWQCN